MRSLLLIISFSFLLISCGNNSGGNAGYPTGPNYNMNNYQFRDHDYHRYHNRRYNYNWNNYNQGQWLSQRGVNDIAYCGNPYVDANGVCYQSCYQRNWQSYTGLRAGYVWSCGYAGCAWAYATQNIPWYSYNWVPYVRAARCF